MPALPPQAAKPAVQTRTADRLLADGRIQRDRYDAAVAYARRTGSPIEDALIEVDAIAEADLLKYLAGVHRTRFVSTEKLSKAGIDRATLEKVPRKVAERYGVVPVSFEPAKSSLSIVIGDPDNVEAIDEVQKAAGVREVKALVARPAAVRAAVRKLYLGEAYAFSTLAARTLQLSPSGHGSSTLDPELFGAAAEAGAPVPGHFVPGAAQPVSGAAVARAVAAFASDPPVLDPPHPPPAPLPTLPLSAPPAAHVVRTAPPVVEAVATSEVYIETLDVLVGLLDSQRPGLRGHSGMVARLVRKLAERLGIGPVEVAAMVVTAYLHDLGKMGPMHLTALNAAADDQHRAAAQKSTPMPRRLMESVVLPTGIFGALDSLYERFDGLGVPGRLSGKDIPLGARLLALVDSFADLTHNPKNLVARLLPPIEACDTLAAYRGTVFDPDLFDLFRAMIAGDDLRARLLAGRHVALLVDPEAEETTALELRLIEEGFEVRLGRTAGDALSALESGEIELVVGEIDIGDPDHDGIALLAEARRHPWGREVPWLIVTRRAGRAEAQRAFELGAIDYVVKPTATEVLVAKIRQALEKQPQAKPARGVAGSLEQMPLPDLVQVLWHGRKSGALHVHDAGASGQIHFVDGNVVDAMWADLRGEEAFYAIIKLQKGEFSLDASFRPAEAPLISLSPETLLLEGMRRMDEGV